MKKILSLIVASSIVTTASITAHAETRYNVSRLYGVDRYKTSVNISNNFSNGKIQNVIIASGKDFPDALTGSILSKKYTAPILLLNNTVNESTDSINYIINHMDKSGTIYILGGSGSISEDFVKYMKNLGYSNIIRLGGINRAETNKVIVQSIDIEKKTPIVITNGYDGFADALSISSIAAAKGYPIFITEKKALPNEIKNTISNIEPSEVYIVGGTGVVGAEVVRELKNLVPNLDDSKIIRVAGNDRYETSLNIAKYFKLNTDTAIIANGTNFPDALSGTALAAKLNAPIILTDGQDIENQKSFINTQNYSNIVLLGGLGSIDFPIEYSFKDPEKISQAEKDYINILLKSCDDMLNNTSLVSKSLSDFSYVLSAIEDAMNKNASEPAPSVEAVRDSFSDEFSNNYSNLANLGGAIGVTEDISNLQSPDGLESLKSEYIKAAQIEHNNMEKIDNDYSDCVSSIDSLIRNSKFPSIYPKGSAAYKKQIKDSMEHISKSIYNLAGSSQYLGSEKGKILQLKQRLEKAKQYMQ